MIVTGATIIITEISKIVRFHMCHYLIGFSPRSCAGVVIVLIFLVRSLEAERLSDSDSSEETHAPRRCLERTGPLGCEDLAPADDLPSPLGGSMKLRCVLGSALTNPPRRRKAGRENPRLWGWLT